MPRKPGGYWITADSINVTAEARVAQEQRGGHGDQQGDDHQPGDADRRRLGHSDKGRGNVVRIDLRVRR